MTSGKSQIAAVIILLTAVFLFSLVNDNSSPGDRGVVTKILPIYKKTPVEESPFLAVELGAKAAYVFDIKNSKVLYAKNENVQLPLASLAKLMTALVAIQNIPADKVVTITPEDIKKEGDSYFAVGERWSLKNIIGLTLVSSSNDGAAAIASAFDLAVGRNESKDFGTFVDKMNETARDLESYANLFLNETGLDVSYDLSGAYGSAKDISKLMIYLFNKNPGVLEVTSYGSVVINSFDMEHAATNTNRVIGDIPGLLSSKTGYTDLAGGNLSIIFEAGPNRPIAITILGSTEEGRFGDVKNLVSATLKSIQEIR